MKWRKKVCNIWNESNNVYRRNEEEDENSNEK